VDIEVVKGECIWFFKWLCKWCGWGFRYLLVYEFYKLGNLYVYVLLYDYIDSGISYRDIKCLWMVGFIDVKLCDWKFVGYVIKYVMKGVGEG